MDNGLQYSSNQNVSPQSLQQNKWSNFFLGSWIVYAASIFAPWVVIGVANAFFSSFINEAGLAILPLAVGLFLLVATGVLSGVVVLSGSIIFLVRFGFVGAHSKSAVLLGVITCVYWLLLFML